MCDGVVPEASERAEETAPDPQVVIFMFGDNDVRKGGIPEDILSDFVEALDQLTAIPYCRVVLCSLVPSYGRYDETKEEFKRLNNHLRILCNGNPKATFCDFTRQLFKDRLTLDGSLYHDDVHLNDRGSEIVAKAIFTHLVKLPRIKTP